MAGFVPSVERVQRPKVGLRETADITSQHASSPSYAFGSRSAAALGVEGKRWTWRWAMTTPSRSVTWSVSEEWQSFPMSQDRRRIPMTASKSLLGPSVVSSSVLEDKTRLRKAQIDRQSVQSAVPRTHPGETAVVVALHWKRRQMPRVLVHPCGPRGTRLGVTPLWPASQAARLGKGDRQGAYPIDTFNSSILQIASSPYVTGNRLDGGATSMLVRLENTTHLINLTPNPEFSLTSSSPSHTVTRVAELDRSFTEGRRHVDVALDPLGWGRAAIVDEGGGVWLWWEEKERVGYRLVKVTKLVKLRSAISDANDGFFRVAFGVRPDSLLVLSRRSVVEIETAPTLASKQRSTELLTLQDSSETFTALERSAPLRRGAFTFVCTTKHVMWIGQSGTHSPALCWRHELGGEQDQDLRLTIVSSQDSPAAGGDTVLVYQPSSGRVHGTLAYDHGLAALVSDPWVLPVSQMGGIGSLIAFSPPKYEEAEGSLALVAIGDSMFSVGKLSLTEDKLLTDRDSLSSSPAIPKVSGVHHPATDLSVLEATVSTTPSKDLVIPARWAWLAINDDTANPLLDPAELNRYLKDPEGNLDTVTTRAELARAAAYPESPTTRSHILRGINYDQSFSASDINSVPLSSHFAFSATSGTLLGDAFEQLTAATLTWHQEAEVEQAPQRLCNDLLLSSKIVYPTDPLPKQAAEARGPTVDELFAEAAGLLSLDDRAPDLSFAVLPPPSHSAPPDANGHCWTSAPSSQDMRTTHTLLLDWKLGADPQQHEWKPSRHSSSAPSPSPPRHDRTGPPVRQFPSLPSVPPLGPRPLSPLPKLHPQLSPARRFPASPVVTERLHSPTFGRTPSSPTVHSDPDSFPQTQIERGAYGARPEAATKASKKKATKRRHGF